MNEGKDYSVRQANRVGRIARLIMGLAGVFLVLYALSTTSNGILQDLRYWGGQISLNQLAQFQVLGDGRWPFAAKAGRCAVAFVLGLLYIAGGLRGVFSKSLSALAVSVLSSIFALGLLFTSFFIESAAVVVPLLFVSFNLIFSLYELPVFRKSFLVFFICNLLGSVLLIMLLYEARNLYEHEETLFYLLGVSLILQAFAYLLMVRGVRLFRVLYIAACLPTALQVVLAVKGHNADGSILLTLGNLVWVFYLLFAKKTLAKFDMPLLPGLPKEVLAERFEAWMFNGHMAMDKFPKEEAENYIKTVYEAQKNQYSQWKYLLAGQRAPLDEARGNALLYSLACFFFGLCMFLLALYLLLASIPHRLLDNLAVCVVLFCIAAFSFLVGWRYVQLYYRRKYVAKMRAAEVRRKRQKYKG